jgi:hypothetical protein
MKFFQKFIILNIYSKCNNRVNLFNIKLIQIILLYYKFF